MTIVLTLVLLLSCRSKDPPAEPPPSPPVSGSSALVFDGPVPTNLLAITVDTTRRDHIGRYAAGDSFTPFLDTRLAEGVALDDHRSCSNWTAPSFLCATTGATPLELGFWPGTGDPAVPGGGGRLDTVARGLAGRGYDTSLVTANRVFSDALDTAQGFDTLIVRDYADADEVVEVARQRLSNVSGAGDPWYLHVHFMDPHRPYCPPEAYREGLDALPVIGVDVCEELELGVARWPDEDEAWRAAFLDRIDVVYNGELASFDHTVGEWWSELEASGALDDTLVMFFADHGEQHMERGVVDHGFDLYAEENRVFAGFWAKNLRPLAWEGPTTHTDLAVTLFELYDLDTPQAATGFGVGEAPEDRVRRGFAYSVVDAEVPQLLVVSGDHALRYNWDGESTFHQLEVDPAEVVDASGVGDPALAGLEAAMGEFVEEVVGTWPGLEGPVKTGR